MKVEMIRDSGNQISLKLAIPILVILSLSIKIGYIVLMSGGLGAFPAEGTDGFFHYQVAMNILKNGTYGIIPGHSITGTPPGEAVLLALLYYISGNSIAFAKFAHVMLLTAVPVIIYLTASRLAGKLIGLSAGILTAIDPAQTYLSATFLAECLYIFLMTLGIYLLVEYFYLTRMKQLVGAGICFALAGLTRNEGWLFVLALLPGSIVTLQRLISIRAEMILLIVTCAILAPWTYRNYRETGEFIPVSSNGGLTLWSGNNPDFVWRQPMPMSLPIYGKPTDLSDPEVDKYYRGRALDWIAGHPAEFLINGVRKITLLYYFDPISARSQMQFLFLLAGLFPYGMMLPFIIIGVVSNLRTEKFWLVLWYILFTTALAFVFFGDSRVRAPIQPYLYLFGCLGITWCFERICRKSGKNRFAEEITDAK